MELWNEHIARKEQCREEKSKDKERAKEDVTFEAVIIDMEAVQNVPKAKAGDFYYVSKISAYNLIHSRYNPSTVNYMVLDSSI